MIHHEPKTIPAIVAARWALRQACDRAGEIGARNSDDWTYRELIEVAHAIAAAANALFPPEPSGQVLKDRLAKRPA